MDWRLCRKMGFETDLQAMEIKFRVIEKSLKTIVKKQIIINFQFLS